MENRLEKIKEINEKFEKLYPVDENDWDYRNAVIEFIEHTKDLPEIKCATIKYEKEYGEDSHVYILLRKNYSIEDYEVFLNQLNFKYDCGYGGQEIFGCIWYKDGTWSTRGEYDGSEWWEYNKCPDYYERMK